MSTLSRFTRGLALVAALAIPALASAQNTPTPQQVVQECVAHMRASAEHAATDMRTGAMQAVAHIHQLAMSGAPAEEILAAGHDAAAALRTRAEHAVQEINTQASQCLALLHQMQAPPAAAHAVIDARAQTLDYISRALRAALHAVEEAVHHAGGTAA